MDGNIPVPPPQRLLLAVRFFIYCAEKKAAEWSLGMRKRVDLHKGMNVI